VALNSAPHASVTTLSQGFDAISSLLSSVVIFCQILKLTRGSENPATYNNTTKQHDLEHPWPLCFSFPDQHTLL
ncbi:hypothetical protein, partial [Nitrosospira sp. Nsp2]|uniref:hypothetical protein n=1 Tax=Nitrosospira sp. Nsp2 TaxID=136548 RepID=UPI001C637E23